MANNNNEKVTINFSEFPFPSYGPSTKKSFAFFLKDRVHPLIKQKDAEVAETFGNCINNVESKFDVSSYIPSFILEHYNKYGFCPFVGLLVGKYCLDENLAINKVRDTDRKESYADIGAKAIGYGVYVIAVCKGIGFFASKAAEKVENSLLCGCTDNHIDSSILNDICAGRIYFDSLGEM